MHFSIFSNSLFFTYKYENFPNFNLGILIDWWSGVRLGWAVWTELSLASTVNISVCPLPIFFKAASCIQSTERLGATINT